MSEFTKEAPKEVGWYWLKYDPEEWPGLSEGARKPVLVAVHEWNGKFWFEDTINREEYECPSEGRLWKGPITPDDSNPVNAELLAAAERCEQLLLSHGDPFRGDDWQAMQDIRAAIAKAKGESR